MSATLQPFGEQIRDMSSGLALFTVTGPDFRYVFSIPLIAGLSYTFASPSRLLQSLQGPDGLAFSEDDEPQVTASATGLYYLTITPRSENVALGFYALPVTPGQMSADQTVVHGTRFTDRVAGTFNDDTIHGNGGNDQLWGDGYSALYNGDDRIFGGAGDDQFWGDATTRENAAERGRDVLVGGDGDDFYRDLDTLDIVREDAGGGIDQVTLLTDFDRYVIPRNVENVFIETGAVVRSVIGNKENNTITDIFNDQDSSLFGKGGADVLDGAAGEDFLDGGAGPDILVGGAGADIFSFGFGDSRFSAPDRLQPSRERGVAGPEAFDGAGVAGGDVIDLSRIDADPNQPGRQAFVFGSPGPGHVWLDDYGKSHTRVRAEYDGAPGADLTILIIDGRERFARDYAAGDFIL